MLNIIWNFREDRKISLVILKEKLAPNGKFEVENILTYECKHRADISFLQDSNFTVNMILIII